MSFDTGLVLLQFRNAMEARGIAPPDRIIADGKMHRCDAVGRKGLRGAAYKLHMNGMPAGGFENHHDGHGWENWKSEIEDTRTPEERVQAAREYEENKRRRAAEAQQNQATAKQRADWIWYHCEEATPDHSYAAKKKVSTAGLGLYKGALVVPMRDIHGELHSLQFIKEDGSKNFLKGGRVDGCFHGIGEPGEKLYVVEGYATGASIHAATGEGVAVAFNSGNLLAVVRALHEKYPGKTIVICADDDALNVLRDVRQEQQFLLDEDAPKIEVRGGRCPASLRNAGLLAAYEAARATGALVALPLFPEVDGVRDETFVRGSVFRRLAARASNDPGARMYQAGVIPFVDRFVEAHPKLANCSKLVWGTIVTYMRKSGTLADETDFNDLQLVSGVQSILTCIERAAPAPAFEVQELSFDIWL
jgi:phage/plasmid primase-like uncharacterized protein